MKMRHRQPRWSLGCALGVALLCPSCKRDAPQPSAVPSANVPAAASVAIAPSASGVAAGSASERPLFYERPVTAADLSDRTLRELSLMRNYPFARAGQEFRKDWLRGYFGQYPWYHPTKAPAEVDQVGRDSAQTIADYDAALRHDELKRRADVVLARMQASKAEPNDALELRLLSERLGEWLVPTGSGVHASPLENPDMLKQVLTLDDLGNLSRRDLRILRNTVYARKGRAFVSEGLQEYFAAKAWYTADDAYTDQRLSAVDWKNIKLVSSVEDSLGGPITDGEHFGRKYGWFGGA